MNIHEAYTIYNNGLKTMNPQLAEAIDRIIDNKAMEIDRLREALEFYADEKNNRHIRSWTVGQWEGMSKVTQDEGFLARKALEGDKQ